MGKEIEKKERRKEEILERAFTLMKSLRNRTKCLSELPAFLIKKCRHTNPLLIVMKTTVDVA